MDKRKVNKPQPEQPMKGHHHIARADDEVSCTHAWYVCVVRNKQRTEAIFSDAVHGSMKNSLQAAIRHRDKLLKKTDMVELLIGYRTNLRCDNKSGVTGVSRIERFNKRYPNSCYIYWVSSGLNQDGVKFSRYFSISRYGEDEARQMAIDERERQMKRACTIMAAREDAHSYRCRKKEPI